MLDLKAFVYFVINIYLVSCIPTPQYLGGQITSSIRIDSNGKYQADVELVTRWVLKTGPCGTHCDKSKIGTSTLPFRNLIEHVSANRYFFGLLSVVSQKLPGLYERQVINDLVKPTMTEVVHDVGEDWEEELMKFTIELDERFAEKTIRFDGYSWRNLTVQGPELNWHLTTDINVGKRSDTQNPNKSPVFMSKRIYRTTLGQTASLKIVSYDVDNDVTMCHDEFGTVLGDIGNVPGVVVKQDCTIELDFSSTHGYVNNTWVAIPLLVKEYPQHGLTVRNHTYANISSIGASGLQFIINVLENVSRPQFVSPSHNSGHEFILIEGDTWTTKVYAKPPTGKSIKEFKIRTVYSETVTMSPIMVDGSRINVRYVTVSWSPTLTDVGKHIICVSAVDNERLSAVDDVCYILNVQRKIRIIGPTSVNKRIQAGYPLTLDCLVSGTKTPVVYWTKEQSCDAHLERFHGSIMHVSSQATIGHEGIYFCTGSDGKYQNVTKQFHVTIIRDKDYHEKCTFETATCGWEQKLTDSMDWALISGPTQTSDTGPDVDHTLGNPNGKYFYIETSSPIQQDDSAGLISPILPANRTICFNFWYHMYGDGVGSLSINIQDSCTLKETTLFTLKGEQGLNWIEHNITILDTMVANDYRIIIEGVAGSTYRGDIAIDDLLVTEGQCKVGTGPSFVG